MIYNILRTELNKIIYKLDILVIIKAILEKILKSTILLNLCINQSFLYNSFIKAGSFVNF